MDVQRAAPTSANFILLKRFLSTERSDSKRASPGQFLFNALRSWGMSKKWCKQAVLSQSVTAATSESSEEMSRWFTAPRGRSEFLSVWLHARWSSPALCHVPPLSAGLGVLWRNITSQIFGMLGKRLESLTQRDLILKTDIYLSERNWTEQDWNTDTDKHNRTVRSCRVLIFSRLLYWYPSYLSCCWCCQRLFSERSAFLCVENLSTFQAGAGALFLFPDIFHIFFISCESCHAATPSSLLCPDVYHHTADISRYCLHRNKTHIHH